MTIPSFEPGDHTNHGRRPPTWAGPPARPSRLGQVRALGGTAYNATRQRLEVVLGGSERSQVIVLLAAVLALSSADSSTVGASATELRHGLHISNADVGLLVTVSAAVGALASVPFGALVDRVRRITLLSITIVAWGVAMAASAMVGNFRDLLLVRLFLGFVTAVAGPSVASLVGDYFPGQERGTIYGYILTGELIGGGVGFFITGDVAAISWRAAFLVLAFPAFFLAWQMRKLTEPPRAGRSQLGRQPDEEAATHHGISEVQKMAQDRGIAPDPTLILRGDPRRLNIFAAARYVVRVRTNMVLIISSACGYFFLTGVQTFGLEFVGKQYGVGTVVASLLMLVVGTGAVLGVLVGGSAGDALVRRGRINGRMLVAGLAAMGTVAFFIPPLLTRSPVTALPYITAAAFCLTAQNPTLDAARLDIVPPLLWGRAEGIRTLLRATAQSIAPVTFGGLSDLLKGTHQGLRYTFLIMLLPLAASGIILLRGIRFYPSDVATAAASRAAEPHE